MDVSISLIILRYVIVAVIICCTVWILGQSTSDSERLRLPPGPPGWPIIGNLPALLRTPTCTSEDYRFSQWSRQYGDIYMVKLGPYWMYVLSNMALVGEAFGHSKIQGRPIIESFKKAFGPRAGSISSSNGSEWMVLRRFAQTLFHDLGVGRELFANVINSEVTRLVAKLDSLSGKNCWEMPELFNTAIGNIVCGITFGHQYDYGDDEIKEIANIMERLTDAAGPAASVSTSKVLLALPFGPGKKLMNVMNDFKKYLQIRIAEAQSEMESEESANNFVKSFLLEMRKGDNYFREESLVACCLEMFFAGTEPTASTLAFAILSLATHPREQVKCQEELANFVEENGGMPSYSDRTRLPYVQAMIHESERFASVGPLGVPHAVEDDNVKLFGYDFPKGSLVVANFDAINMDEKKFLRPYEFRPERFMENGHFEPHPDIRPFSIGRRSCLGEPLARMEIFLILANLMHSFTFTALANTEMPDPRMGVYGLTRTPLPFGVDIRRRGEDRGQRMAGQGRGVLRGGRMFDQSTRQASPT